MTTASSRATATRIGNSRQNERFLRPRRAAGLRPPEVVLPSSAESAALSPSGDGPLASAVLLGSALLLAWAVLLVSAWAGSGAVASGVSAPLIRAPSETRAPRRGSPSSSRA
jgi:hypothetical protein